MAEPTPDTHHLFTFAVAVARPMDGDYDQDAHACEEDLRTALAASGLVLVQADHHPDSTVLFWDGEDSTLPEVWR